MSLPPGVTLDSAPHDAGGLPPGVTLDPTPHDAAPPTTVPEQPSVASRAVSGIGQSLDNNIVQPVKSVVSSVVTPPEDHKEQIAHAVAGTPGLQLYRLSRAMYDSVENLIDAPRENYKQGIEDFKKGVDAVQKHHYGNALISAASTAADTLGMMPGPGAVVGPKARELTEGMRPGGDLVTPLVRDVTDAALLYGSEKLPEAAGAVKKAAKSVAKSTGVGGLDAAESLQKAAGGSAGVAERNFKENANRALPHLVAEDGINPIGKKPEDLAEAAHTAKSKLWDQITDKVKSVTDPSRSIISPDTSALDGIEISKEIKDSVSDAVRDHQPEVAKAIDKWADTFAKVNNGKYPLEKVPGVVSHMNAELYNTYKMDTGTRAAYLASHPEIGMYEDAAESLRSRMDAKLEELGESSSAELRKDYGALAQMERVFEKRAITYGRQVPISLKQGLAYMAAAAGHPLPIAAALAEKYVNSPGYLIRNALDKKSAMTVPSVVKPVANIASKSAIASGSTTPTETSSQPEGEWVHFTSGKGEHLMVHPEDWAQIQKVDPSAKKVE